MTECVAGIIEEGRGDRRIHLQPRRMLRGVPLVRRGIRQRDGTRHSRIGERA
jgi:hypothetical protein